MVDINGLIGIKGNINAGIKTALKKANTNFAITQLDIEELEPSEDNFYELRDIEAIKESIENFGIQQNIIVMKREGKKYEIIAGHRRYAACKILAEEGKEEFNALPCRILPTMDDTLKNILIIHTNSETRIKTPWEITEEIERLKILYRNFKKTHPEFKGKVRNAVAKDLGLSPSTLGRHENISNNLIEEVKKEYKENKIGVSNADKIASLPRTGQEKALEKIQEKGSIDSKDIKEIKEDLKVVETLEKTTLKEEFNKSLAKINAAKHVMSLLEKAIQKSSSLRDIEEAEGNIEKANQQIVNIEYMGGIMKKVQADLFNMTGDNLFKE